MMVCAEPGISETLRSQAAQLVEELVEPGQLDPDAIHTPGIFVRRIVLGRDYKKPIEQRTVRPRPAK